MKGITSTAVSFLLIIATLFESGCATTPDGRTTQIQGTAIGAIGGALLGAALGAATGNRDNISRFALAGAAAGGVAGYAYGTAVAKRKARYARAEDWLNQEIVLARQANHHAYVYNGTLRQRVASLSRQVAAAKAAHNRTALHSLKSQIAQISNEAKAEDQKQAGATQDQKVILGDAQARRASNFSSYQKEANSFNQAKAERGQLVGRLASLDNSLDR